MPEKLQLLSGNKVYTDEAIDSKFKTEPTFFIVDTLPDADDPRVQKNAVYYKKLPLDPDMLEGFCYMQAIDTNNQYVWQQDAYVIVEELPVDLTTVNENTVFKLMTDDDTAFQCVFNESHEKILVQRDLVLLTRLPAANDSSVLPDTIYKLKVTLTTPTLVAYVLGKDAHGNNCWYTDGDTKATVAKNYNDLMNKPRINGEVFWGNMDLDKATTPVSEDGISGGYDLSLTETDIKEIVSDVFNSQE